MSLTAQDVLTRRLQANLNAIQLVDPALGDRICWPVGDDHTRIDENGNLLCRFHRTWFELEPDAAKVEQLGKRCKGSETIVLAGIGLGTQLGDLLDRFPKSKIVAWDRDPVPLRGF